jgi:class 3 adenylate cyclase/pimeloyl-ACP methyl ester carboxylesterase
MWEDPGFTRVGSRLAAFSRTIWVDPRGWGASEGDPRDSYVGPISDADLLAVMDATGVEQAAFVGWSAAGTRVIHFAATYPERVRALVLVDAFAHYVIADDYPWGYRPETLDRVVASLEESWGTAVDMEVTAPSRVGDAHFRAWWARTRRASGGPTELAKAFRQSLEWDLRSLLPSIRAPTLVVHREGDRFVRLGAGRYLAEHIKGARLVVLPGDDHLSFVGDGDALVDEIEEFLTGGRSGAEADVRLAAVLFTDIVASTEHQARVGQREWSRLTDRHDAMVRDILAQHRGREVKTTGDGFLATFDAVGIALRCAVEIVSSAQGLGLELRSGMHAGEVETRGEDIGGLAVSIAKRVCDLASAGEVLVSETLRTMMVGSGTEFIERGEYQLKGVPGSWRLYAVRP